MYMHIYMYIHIYIYIIHKCVSIYISSLLCAGAAAEARVLGGHDARRVLTNLPSTSISFPVDKSIEFALALSLNLSVKRG